MNNNQVAWEIVYGDQSIQWEMGHCKQKRNRRFRQLTLRTVRIGYKFKCIKNKNAKIKKYKYQIKTHRKSRWEVSLKIFLKIFFWILKFKRDFPKKRLNFSVFLKRNSRELKMKINCFWKKNRDFSYWKFLPGSGEKIKIRLCSNWEIVFCANWKFSPS